MGALHIEDDDMGHVSFPKPESRAREKRDRTREKARAWEAVRQAVLVRDGRRCRVCGSRDGVEVHHVRFRSAGGGDSTANCVTLCRIDHAEIHAYRLTLSGDANGVLKVTRAKN